ncbi:MAG: hypothetical protein GQ532_00200 [Methylomarinum sp.]|nr:hypothetical protein [Methylomarinum sp.]
MPLINLILKSLKTTLLILAHNIFGSIVVGLIGISVLISWATGTLSFLLDALQTPVQLWETTTLVLLVSAYTHLKTVKNHSSKYLKKREILFESDNFKWKTVIHSPNFHTVENIPFCKLHNKRLIEYEGNYVCPDKNNDVCETVLKSDKYQLLKDIAESEAEHIIRTNNY